MTPGWIDTHCHLDAPEFAADRAAVLARAHDAGVGMLVLPAVQAADFEAVREPAHATGQAYALGIHPLLVDRAEAGDLDRLAAALARYRDDPRLVAVGEIGLDFFVPGHDAARQQRFYAAQLALARAAGLPLILHVRRSADALLAGLRRGTPGGAQVGDRVEQAPERAGAPLRGIVHAFNGSAQQAQAFVDLGFRLGFGGAMTFERALRIRRLAATLPETALVLETDAPDIPPQWLYRDAVQRAAGERARNEPAELPRIAATLAGLRGWSLAQAATITRANALAALPRLAALVAQPASQAGAEGAAL